MPQVFFYLFSILAVIAACSMVIFKNPVSSALSMVGAFVGLAALFVGLNAYFVGVIQILVYAGAIMVLFIFIIMLLDLKSEESRIWKPTHIAMGVIVPFILICQLLGVVLKLETPEYQDLNLKAAAKAHHAKSVKTYRTSLTSDEEFLLTDVPVSKIQSNLEAGQLPDVHLIGRTVFAGLGEGTSHNLPLQIMGVLLLVATIGVVILSKKNSSSSH